MYSRTLTDKHTVITAHMTDVQTERGHVLPMQKMFVRTYVGSTWDWGRIISRRHTNMREKNESSKAYDFMYIGKKRANHKMGKTKHNQALRNDSP